MSVFVVANGLMTGPIFNYVYFGLFWLDRLL